MFPSLIHGIDARETLNWRKKKEKKRKKKGDLICPLPSLRGQPLSYHKPLPGATPGGRGTSGTASVFLTWLPL
jgi:hypothetical protein